MDRLRCSSMRERAAALIDHRFARLRRQRPGGARRRPAPPRCVRAGYDLLWRSAPAVVVAQPFQVMWARGRHRLQRSMTGSLACGVLALSCGCGDGPRTVDPAEMPASVDVAQLRGDRVSQTPCTFAHAVDRGMPSGSGVVRLWLECPRTDGVLLVGFVEVASVPVVESARTGDLPDEDSIRCVRDARETQLQSCDLRHGEIAAHARATCDPDRCNAEDEARDLMAGVVELLARLPEQPCRLCPNYLPPERAARLTGEFSGTGPNTLGTIEVKVDSRIRYVTSNGEFAWSPVVRRES